MSKKDFSGNDFYVYAHRRVSDGRVFYIGKGRGRRAWVYQGRSDWWVNVASKHGWYVEIIKDGMTNACSLTMEKIEIAKNISLDQPIVNLTSGGDGAPGSVRSEMTNITLSRSQGGRAVFCSNGMRFETAVLAARWLRDNGWPKASRVNISRTCLGKVGSAYGFTWWHNGDCPKSYTDKRARISKHRSKTVYCSNGMVFPSLKDSGKWVHSQGCGRHAAKQIGRCLSGRVRIAHGLSWSYEDIFREVLPD